MHEVNQPSETSLAWLNGVSQRGGGVDFVRRRRGLFCDGCLQSGTTAWTGRVQVRPFVPVSRSAHRVITRDIVATRDATAIASRAASLYADALLLRGTLVRRARIQFIRSLSLDEAGARGLLDNMHQLVREEARPAGCARGVLSRAERNMITHRVGERTHSGCGSLRHAVIVYPHL